MQTQSDPTQTQSRPKGRTRRANTTKMTQSKPEADPKCEPPKCEPPEQTQRADPKQAQSEPKGDPPKQTQKKAADTTRHRDHPKREEHKADPQREDSKTIVEPSKWLAQGVWGLKNRVVRGAAGQGNET